jgi:D-xylose 1-dehydrogenase (NADP+, D-xylono-1,5-lactone-forming)
MAVASRSLDKARDYAASWGIPKFYGGYEALLADPEIDIVYNSLPNSLHAEWSIKAMRMGKNVLCEKPITTSSADLESVINVAKETGMVITEAYMYRHHPQTALVKQMIEEDELGKLQLIRGSFSYLNTRETDPRFDLALGGGSLWDIGCYPVGYTSYLVGRLPEEVYGYLISGPTGIDLLYTGQMRFAAGIVAQFDCSFISEHNVEMIITGDKGRLTISEPFKPGKQTRILLQQSGHEQVIKVRGQELYQGEVEDMENAVLNSHPPRISLSESKGIIQTLEALYQSARHSKPILLES